ncbi:MAG: hypothetical protein Q9187_000355 [Circinaria calcarea]
MMEWQSQTPMPDLARRTKDPDWERKQRDREYRVAARREKRNRKADEKKQRKLNATILRRMTRNPDKYTKNAERNRLRDIDGERRKIWTEALKQAQRLAAVHDPSGAMFNVGPVITQEDGTVISLETIKRRQEREAMEQAKKDANLGTVRGTYDVKAEFQVTENRDKTENGKVTGAAVNGINPARLSQIDAVKPRVALRGMSKTQQKRIAAMEPRPPPQKPIIPDGISLPEGEEDWLALWDLPDEQLERRVIRAKRRKAAERKALRAKQQCGKIERRAARDEKRKVYRELKLTWKTIKEEETRHKTKVRSVEEEEAKRIAVEINRFDRKAALDQCAQFGFTLENTPGVNEIKPKALGMKGVDVDFEALELGESLNDVKPKGSKKRVDLSTIPEQAGTQLVPSAPKDGRDSGEYIKLDVGEGQDYEALNFNHKLRRKLRRAIESAEIRKEVLVRERVIDLCKERGIEPPPEISTPAKPVHLKGHRVLENGTLETEKRERVRMRMELAEYNQAARVLRKQAKQIAMEAGLRVYAEMTGRIPPRGSPGNEENSINYGPGWYRA